MSEAADKESKTEEATQKRLEQSVDEGDAPVAREPAVAAAMCASWLALMLVVGKAVTDTSQTLAVVLQEAGTIPLGGEGDLQALLAAIVRAIATAWLPVFATVALAGVLASLVQTQKLFAGKRIRPDLSRVSLSKGLSRLFGKGNLVEFAKSVVKLCVLVLLTAVVVRRQWPALVDLQFTEVVKLPVAIAEVLGQLLALVSVALVVIAAVDVFATRFAWRKGLRMTKQEVRQEFKESEGDPGIAARRKAIARGRIRSRLSSAVPRATVVIANPTHYAVALRYVPTEGGAPIVVAKGTDFVALTIRTMAESQGIPVVENKALARSMHDRVTVDQQIPADFYRAVADVLILLQRRGKQNRF